MTTINLKDFYYWYLVDELVEVPDEVAEELMAGKRAEAAHAERVRYNKAYLILGKSYRQIAHEEGVDKCAVRRSVKSGIERMKKYLRKNF